MIELSLRYWGILFVFQNYTGILLILILERIIVYHQQQYYNRPNVQKPKTGIIFSEIKREQADDGVISCVKYFLNFFFYKFGLEVGWNAVLFKRCFIYFLGSSRRSQFLNLFYLSTCMYIECFQCNNCIVYYLSFW